MPLVAVCVCTCRRPALLDRLLAVLEGLEPGGSLGRDDVALVVVDNRPGDGSARAVCEARRDRLPMGLTFVEEPEPGISYARNAAVAAALRLGAELIAFIDDDDEPFPCWLGKLVATQRASGADMVFGAWRHPEGLTPPRPLGRVRFFQPMRLDSYNSYGLPGWAGTFNVLLTRALVLGLAEHGEPVFRPEFALTGGGDTDLFIRAHKAGYAHAVAPDSVVYRQWEADRMTVRGVMRRAFRIGCTRIQLASSHMPPERLRKVPRRSAAKLARILARLPLRVTRPETLVVQLVRAAQHAGEVYAATGRRFVYYDRDDARTPAPVVAAARPSRQPT